MWGWVGSAGSNIDSLHSEPAWSLTQEEQMGSWHLGHSDIGVRPEERGTAGERGSCTLRIQEMALEMGLTGLSHRG